MVRAMAGLKIDATESRAHFTVTTASTGPFVINFGNLGKTELEVYVGENTKLSPSAWNFVANTTQGGMPLDFGSAGGTITLVAAVANTTVTVVGRQRNVVETDFSSHADFNFAALNASVARITLQTRDLAEKMYRLSQYPEGDILTSPQYYPAKAVRANNTVYWDANGIIGVGPPKVDVELVASIAAAIATVAGISGSVVTVAGISANVTAVAGNAANITTVAGISANVTTVAGISGNRPRPDRGQVACRN